MFSHQMVPLLFPLYMLLLRLCSLSLCIWYHTNTFIINKLYDFYTMKVNSFRLYIANNIMHILPETRFFRIKSFLFKLSGVKIGKNVRICSSAHIIGNGILSIGDNTFIGPHTFIHVSSLIYIEKNCDISSNVIILNGSHEIDLEGEHIAGKGKSEDVYIGEGTWICTNATLLGSSRIGAKCLVAASSTTKGQYPDNTIIKGCIAKPFPIIK